MGLFGRNKKLKPPIEEDVVSKTVDSHNEDLFGFNNTDNSSKATKNQKNQRASKSKNQKKINLPQQYFEFKENTYVIGDLNINGTKKGLSNNDKEISQDQIQILKKCKPENTALELMKILKRSNKTKFKQTILTPLVELGFFELSTPEKPTSPKQKYHLTGKFVRKIPKVL
jgi:hypothetical protein